MSYSPSVLPGSSASWVLFSIPLSEISSSLSYPCIPATLLRCKMPQILRTSSKTNKTLYYILLYTISQYTSSTAQGGGGSFRIGNLQETLVVVNHGWQSELTDGSKGGWSVGLPICPSSYLAIQLSSYLDLQLSSYLDLQLSSYLAIELSSYPAFQLSIQLFFYLSIQLAIYLPIYLFICRSILIAIQISIYRSIYLSIYLSINLG